MGSNNVPTTPMTVADVEERLSAIRAKRGYLLPHHGLLAVATPTLLEAYDGMYSELTLREGVLSLFEKEVIWLIILVSTGEAIATHHIDRLRKAGGGEAEVEAALALAAWSEGAGHHRFVETHWAAHLEGFDAVASYRAGLAALLVRYPVKPWVAEVGLAAAHQCHRQWEWVGEHLAGAYREGASEVAIAEGLALAMFPGGVPNFVDACEIWKDMILAGKLEASEPFNAWAQLTGQGGFDEAAGVK